MMDYGEFVPDELLISKDDNMRALGERMELWPMTDNFNTTEEEQYAGMVEKVFDGTHAVTETFSYLK